MVNAGILSYNPHSDLSVTLNPTAQTMTLLTLGTNPTLQLQSTITPTFFDAIKATTNAKTRTSSNPVVATIDAT
jgi:hypothetical protein